MNNYIPMERKTWIIVGGITLILIAGLILYFLNKNTRPKQAPLEVIKTDLGIATIPTGLPANLPSEVGSKVLQNYEAKTNDGRMQFTRQITSKKDARTALDVYVEFFKTLGYTGGFSEASSAKDGQQIAQMVKDKNLLMIVASPSVEGPEQSTVEIILNQPNK